MIASTNSKGINIRFTLKQILCLLGVQLPTYFYKSHIVKKYCVYVIVRKRIQNEDRYISLRFVSRTFESMFDLDTNINHHLQRNKLFDRYNVICIFTQ